MTWESLIVSLISGGGASLLVCFFFLGKYKEKVDNIEKMDISSIKTNIAILMEFKIWATKFLDDKLFQSRSPLTLTPEGQSLIKDSGFQDIFEKVKNDLAQRLLETKNPTTQYDAQEYARGLMDDISREEYDAFLPIKTYAFEKGKDYAQILRAGSILLRDYYLAQHPEIKN